MLAALLVLALAAPLTGSVDDAAGDGTGTPAQDVVQARSTFDRDARSCSAGADR